MFSLLRTLCVGFAVGNSAEQISTVGGYEDPEYVGYGLFVGCGLFVGSEVGHSNSEYVGYGLFVGCGLFVGL
jgi:hypothetical protein